MFSEAKRVAGDDGFVEEFKQGERDAFLSLNGEAQNDRWISVVTLRVTDKAWFEQDVLQR